MNEQELIKYYNKFNEDKRLTTKHGNIEYLTTLKYINKYLKKGSSIIEIGAGTGRYSISLYNEGYSVTAVELVKHNLREIERKCKDIPCIQANAIDLKIIQDNSFDAVLLLGPMYHLLTNEEKIKALNEAKRIVKKNGLIFISYCMNEYAVITHGFIEGNIKNCIENNLLDSDYHVLNKNTDLYSMVRLEDINHFKKFCGLKRIKILSQDGPSEYIKKTINSMNDTEYKYFIEYHLKTCERKDLLGAGRHILDILKKID